MEHKYSYQFRSENTLVSVQVEYLFNDVVDLESISQFPHRHRRQLAHYMLSTPENTFHMGDTISITNPFVVALNRLFNGQYWYYWTTRHMDTLIYITGFSAFSFLCFQFRIQISSVYFKG